MNNVFDINIGRVFYLPAVDFDIATGINFGVVSVDGVVGLSNSHAITIKLVADVNRSQAVDSGAILVFYGFCTDFYTIGAINDSVFSCIKEGFCANGNMCTIDSSAVSVFYVFRCLHNGFSRAGN